MSKLYNVTLFYLCTGLHTNKCQKTSTGKKSVGNIVSFFRSLYNGADCRSWNTSIMWTGILQNLMTITTGHRLYVYV